MLGQADELVGRNVAVRGMSPATQRFNADRHAGSCRDLGLVVHGQAVVVDRAAQIPGQRQQPDAGEVLLGVVDHHARTLLLGRVHGHVGATDQRGRCVAVLGKQRDAHAGLDLQRQSFDLERFLQGLNQLTGQLLGVLQSRRRHQHRKLVPAQTRDRIRLSNRRLEPARDLA